MVDKNSVGFLVRGLWRHVDKVSSEPATQQTVYVFAGGWEIGVSKDSFVLILAGIAAPLAAGPIGEGGVVAIAGGPLVFSVRGNSDVLRVGGLIPGLVGEDRAAFVDGINVASA